MQYVICFCTESEVTDTDAKVWVKCYKLGNSWYFKPVHSVEEASKFGSEKSAEWVRKSFPSLDDFSTTGVLSWVEPVFFFFFLE